MRIRTRCARIMVPEKYERLCSITTLSARIITRYAQNIAPAVHSNAGYKPRYMLTLVDKYGFIDAFMRVLHIFRVSGISFYS